MKKTSKTKPNTALLTKIDQAGEEKDFLLTKVLEPKLLYYANDQSQIAGNLKRFGISPSAGTSDLFGVVFNMYGKNCIITIEIVVANKKVLTQFLIKHGLTAKRYKEMITDKKYDRFKMFTDIILQGIELTRIKPEKREAVQTKLTENKTVLEGLAKHKIAQAQEVGKEAPMAVVKDDEYVTDIVHAPTETEAVRITVTTNTGVHFTFEYKEEGAKGGVIAIDNSQLKQWFELTKGGKDALMQTLDEYVDKNVKTPFSGLEEGQTVSHEDYTSEVFTITKIDRENNVVHTAGGKNGTWSNPPEMIIRLDNVEDYLAKYGK